jgi:hypothetical protein
MNLGCRIGELGNSYEDMCRWCMILEKDGLRH